MTAEELAAIIEMADAEDCEISDLIRMSLMDRAAASGKVVSLQLRDAPFMGPINRKPADHTSR